VAIRSDCSALPVAFLYWGRRGALPRLTLDLARAALGRPDLDLHLSISYQNELFADHVWLDDRLLPIDTFRSAAGALRAAPAVPHRLRDLRRRLQERGVRVAVALMPHLWTPLLAPELKRAGIAYIPVVHDAAAHAGDTTGIANWWLLRNLHRADRIVTLSPFLTRALVSSGRAPDALIDTLFLPDLNYGGGRPAPADDAAPLRILFFGRILRYKGLPLFVDAIDLLARRGTRVEAGVFGAGDLAECGERLRALGAEVANRWIDDGEIASILARYDVMVLSHIEASQSGVAAAALGAGMPVVATPVGGLVDQVEHEKTGLLAGRADAAALADAIERLAQDRSLLRAMVDEIARRRGERSMSAFLDRMMPIAQRAAQGIAAAPAR
jgi:glycosyltransferase involved in cell wall biosynthesis